MSRPRIAIAGFQHETNTFTPFPTTWSDFERGGAWPALTRGDDIVSDFAGLNIPISGFIAEAGDFELVPIVWIGAEPGGYVTSDAFERVCGLLLDGLAGAGRLDGIYLDLHGAMVTDDHQDGEGEILARVRHWAGPDLPMVASLDLHANLTARMVAKASGLTIYRTYPHIDMAETGRRAARLMAATLVRGRPYAAAFRQLDYLIPIQAQSTMREPGRRLYESLAGLEGNGVVSLDLAFGFPPADIADCGAAWVAYGEDEAAATRAGDALHADLAASEGDFRNPLVPAPEAVRQAMAVAQTATRPVVICDPQDNPGAGGTGSSTGLLAALIAAGARNTAMASLWDPDTAQEAHEAGIGAEFHALIGGRYPESDGAPVAARVRVEALSDGAFTFTGPMYGGARARLGPMARLLILDPGSEVRLVVASRRAQNADQAHFRHIGIEPTQQTILAIKSAVHFLADYEPIAEKVIFAEAPGANPCQLDRIAYTRLRPGLRLGPHGPVWQGRSVV